MRKNLPKVPINFGLETVAAVIGIAAAILTLADLAKYDKATIALMFGSSGWTLVFMMLFLVRDRKQKHRDALNECDRLNRELDEQKKLSKKYVTLLESNQRPLSVRKPKREEGQ
jgi:hypothetical protein